jgi:hypothetical protein
MFMNNPGYRQARLLEEPSIEAKALEAIAARSNHSRCALMRQRTV